MASQREPPPRFSVVMPVYQRQAAAEQAIASVLAQSFSDFELIVVDDGSPEPFALPEAAQADTRVRLIRHWENRGPSAARNEGAAATRGEWIAWIDSDDRWHRRKLELQDRFVATFDPGTLAAVATGFRYTKGEKGGDSRIPIPASGPDLYFTGCWFCPGSTTVVPREAMRQVGGYDETLRRFEDVDWFIRFGLAGGQLRVVEEVLADIRWGAAPPLQLVGPAAKALISKTEAMLPGRSGQLRDLRAYLHLALAASAWESGRYAIFASQLGRSFALRPRLRLQVSDFWPSAPKTGP